MATVANPSYQRVDSWHLLDDAAQQLAAVHRAGLPHAREMGRSDGRRIASVPTNGIGSTPGAGTLAKLLSHPDDGETDRLAAAT